MKKHMLIAGGSGMIGSALRKEAILMGWEVSILSRTKGKDVIIWDPEQTLIHLPSPHFFDAIINLAGASIAGGRWTVKRKTEILQSRIHACKTIEQYLRDGRLQTNVYIGASAVGIYGNSGSEAVDEQSEIATTSDWMALTVQAWEAGHSKIAALGIRTIILRIGIVLSNRGGAFQEIMKSTRFGLLTFFGTGDQIWPWIHIQDLIHIILTGLNDPQMKGMYQASAPNPVSNKKLTYAVKNQLRFPRIMIGIPLWILSLVLGKMHQMLMQSCNAIPTRLIQAGFEFKFSTIQNAMKDLIGNPDA
jgi:uncharacterized protein (TIGR01777 family)